MIHPVQFSYFTKKAWWVLETQRLVNVEGELKRFLDSPVGNLAHRYFIQGFVLLKSFTCFEEGLAWWSCYATGWPFCYINNTTTLLSQTLVALQPRVLGMIPCIFSERSETSGGLLPYFPRGESSHSRGRSHQKKSLCQAASSASWMWFKNKRFEVPAPWCMHLFISHCSNKINTYNPMPNKLQMVGIPRTLNIHIR